MNLPGASALRAFLLAVILPCYRPRASGSVWQWAEKHVYLGRKMSPGHPGLYDSSLTPYARTIQDFLNDPDWDELIVKKSSQCGATEAVLNCIRYCVAEKPTNIIYAIDSAGEAKKICRTRLEPTIREFIPPGLASIVEDDDLQAMLLDLPHMTIYMAGGFSGGGLANKPCGVGVVDEADEHPKPRDGETESVDKVRERLKTVDGSKLFVLGRPTTETGVTCREYETGTCEKMFVACPHCGFRQELTLEGMAFDHCKDMLGEWDLKRVRAETYYRCGSAECRESSAKGIILDEHKYAMNLGHELRVTNLNHVPRKRSLHISDLYSPFVTWGELAVEFVSAVKSGSVIKLQAFYNSRLALEFRQQRTEVSENDVLALRGAYKRGSCPFPFAETVLITHQTDKQGDVFKSIRCAWKRAGECAIIDWKVTLAEQDLLDWAAEPTIVFAGETTPGMTPKIGLIDEGFKTTEVRDFCIRSNGFYHPSKGRGGIQVKSVVNESTASHNGLEMIVYHYDDDDFKKQLYVSRIAKFKDILSGKSKVTRLWLPVDVDDDFVRELHAERLVEQKQKWGFVKWVWEKTGDNDFGDALKMAYVIWHVIGHNFQTEEAAPPIEEKGEVVAAA